ncbi:MAG TPA: polysaccharide deacetylase family protein [Longimicrobiaceae bacterium]
MKRNALRVLTYHRVIDPADAPLADPALISAVPSAFERQMRFLARRYRPVRPEEMLEAARGGTPLPERAVLVTFDDAYRDFGEIAWPIMRRHRVPATVFVATAYPDHPEREFWWDQLHRAFARTSRAELSVAPALRLSLDGDEARRRSLRSLQSYLKRIPHAEAMELVARIREDLGDAVAMPGEVLGWSDLRALAADGVTLGGHTHTHPAMNQLPLDELRSEVHGSRDILEREIGPAAPIFAYPFGAHDPAAVEVVRRAGYELAMTAMDGHNRIGSTDPLRLRRTNVTRRTTPRLLRLRLLPLFPYVDRWRHRAEAA